ncbi:phosphodiesterase [Sphingomonas sp. CGMCC 1.13654]|uniref:Phosphodiesterase n=1 Tax=Sphingomonas chungangi TaxID=2683589 RepID=A0A838L6S0_9SPHN|nr:phosphodiesterase [Sphingomonas chungangi]MBA2933268.1 phosphodiesterase [Sphingomonas chungangi]
MLIAQISDLHIQADAAGDENSGRLQHVVRYLRKVPFRPDMLIISGDMTEDGLPESYERLREIIAPIDCPILLAVGNHDRRATFLSVFPETQINGGFVQYALDLGERRIVVLDTLEEGSDGGAFCEGRAAWLRATLAERPEAETLIVLHHPPALTGIGWMDIHPDDAWTGRLAAVIREAPQVVHLIAGHVHRPIAMAWAGRVLTVTSSTAPQVALDLRAIDPEAPDERALIVDELPGLAWHRWTATGIATHFDLVDEPMTIVRFDRRHQRMIRDLTRLTPSD